MSKDVKKQLQSLIKLISFFKQIRHQDELQNLGFFFVNDLFNLIPFRQCILWTYKGGKVSLTAASGQMEIEKNSLLAQFVTSSVKAKISANPLAEDKSAREEYIKEHGYAEIADFTQEDRASLSEADLQEFVSPHIVNVTFWDEQGVIGGLWLSREEELGHIERAILEDAGDALAEKILFFSRKRSKFDRRKSPSKLRVALLIAFLIFCCWPVRFSITTSAEVIAKDATVVTVPFDGLIEEINVDPNAQVKKGDLLFSLEKTRLKNQYALSRQSLVTAKEKLAKTQREVFSDPEKIPDLNILKEEVKLKNLELDYAKDRLDISDIISTHEGVILFSDKNDLLGKPAKIGEPVMTLANPQNIELLVRIPSDGMIDIHREIPLRFFLNTAPLKSHKALLHNISYQPSPDPSGLMTYKARAKIEDIDEIEKIGLTGTAKLYGGRTIMILNLLRRPFIALRSLSGF